MAKTVRSVAIRYLHGQEMPTPPPMVIPSMNTTPRLGYVYMRWFIRYSWKKKACPAAPWPSRSIGRW